jgi:hypothetical protein
VKIKGVLSTAIAMSTGIILLLGYFFNLGALREVILNWAIILAGVAVFVGVANLLLAHARKLSVREKNWPYSAVLILALLLTLLAGLLLGPQHKTMTALFNMIQFPVEASLMAVLAVTFTYASIRLLRQRLNLFSIIFLATTVLILLGTAAIPLVGYVPMLGDIVRPIIAQVFAVGGARGILIGVALGTLTTGLRVLFGGDRPYGGK